MKTLVKLIKHGISCACKGVKFNIEYKLSKGSYPTFLIYKATMRCNSRCKTCNIWKGGEGKIELTIEELDTILTNPFWKEVKYVNITGGEPFLRKDLVDILHIIKRNLPKVRIIAIPTNGLLTNKIVKDVDTILSSILSDAKILLSVTVSIDGDEKTHNFIRGVPIAYHRAINTLNELKKLEAKYPNFTVGIETVVSSMNLHILEDILAYHSRITDHLNYTPMIYAPYFENESNNPGIRGQNLARVAEFYQKLKDNNPSMAYYYENVVRYLKKGRRSYPCLGGYKTICLESNGDVTPCVMLPSVVFGNALKEDIESVWFGERAWRIRKHLKKSSFCKHCLNNCDIINNYSEEFLHFIAFLLVRPKIIIKLYRSLKEGKYSSKYINAL